MTMQHKRGSFFNFANGEVEIRDYALLKVENAQRAQAIRINQLGLASRRIADEYPHLAAWFCLRTTAGREFLVESALIDAKVQALVPTRKGDKIMKRHRIIPAPTLPVLPGYVLVRCVPAPGAMAGLRRFERVLDVIGTAEKPYRVPDKFVSKFIEKAVAGEYDHRPPAPADYPVGQPVRVIDGPFASFPGTVTDFDGESCRIRVEVMIFGRATPVELDVAQIEKV
ncbi:transcription termination/antitermination protein NusG [Neorhizobium alkalisoli]|uniref:Transcription termination/antitermination protein NusG n=1 Tax=Neorhizobium alkalisoli TaxID=528178 RepID=A0A561QS76_9HYPH|nr:transcription termination/antitermination protein NusG [Neorhizobium alkalisoli]TWF53251.1 transcription antitermination protein nusG [Neorhizobium alkalisoli]